MQKLQKNVYENNVEDAKRVYFAKPVMRVTSERFTAAFRFALL